MNIRLPFPDPALFPNRAAGKHWGSVRAIKDKARDDAFLLAKQALVQSGYEHGGGLITLDLTFCQPDNRHRDLDGMLSASKSALDGVARALGVDDRMFDPINLSRGRRGAPGELLIEVGP